jgi:NAD-dependent deacetylase
MSLILLQNIDNLHNRAGSRRVTELHGNIERNYCIKCRTFVEEVDVKERSVLKCENCGGLVRPDVVWFGEMLPPDSLRHAENCAMSSDVFFSIGTSAEVYPAAMLPMIAKQSGAYVVEVNIKPTALSYDIDEMIKGKKGEILKKLVEVIKSKK